MKEMTRAVTGLLCCVLFTAPLLDAQMRRTSPTSRGRSANPNIAAKDEPLPTFHGTFQSAANGKLYLNTEDENQLEFYVSKKTTFYDGDKKVKPGDIKAGTKIAVDAKRIVATRMDAVTVRIETEK